MSLGRGKRVAPTWLLLGVLLMAARLRLWRLDWDGGIGAHPDERYIVGVAEALRWPGRLNPFDVASDYAYGHLPLYLLAAVRWIAPGVDALLLGRGMAALFDVGTVALLFALGRRVYGERVGLLAAAFVALMVQHVQQAHFYTVDVLLAMLVTGALFFAVRFTQGGRMADASLAGLFAGLAVGTKASAALLMVPLVAACSLASEGKVQALWRCGVAALGAFALTNPFALLDLPLFWRNVAKQAAIARGALDVPYTRQFHATWPYLYPILQQFRWGMGWILGLMAFGGLIYAVWQAVRRPPRPAEWVLLSWALPFFAFTGALYAKFPRYLLPLTPLLAIYAARLLGGSASHTDHQTVLEKSDRRWGRLLIGLSLVCSLLRALAFMSIYTAPHPWLRASAWLRDHAERDAVIAVEQWDHPLPLDAASYDVRELPVFEEETSEKWEAMEEMLAEADYVIVASRRGYATLPRWPQRYARTARYYQELFAGDLGFEPVACFGRYPRLGPVALMDDPTEGLAFSLPELCRPRAMRASASETIVGGLSEADMPLVLSLGRLDESFVVYDRPCTIVFQRRD